MLHWLGCLLSGMRPWASHTLFDRLAVLKKVLTAEPPWKKRGHSSAMVAFRSGMIPSGWYWIMNTGAAIVGFLGLGRITLGGPSWGTVDRPGVQTNSKVERPNVGYWHVKKGLKSLARQKKRYTAS